MGGNAPTAGTAGTAASAGTGGAGGVTPNICSFTITGAISADIPTVGVIDWSTDLKGLTAARIEFSLDDPQAGELNVGSGGPISATAPQALMLGLKASRSYTYRIVATAGATVCVSPNQLLSTPADPDAPVVTRVAGETAASRANGFIINCPYQGSFPATIIDADGAVVWRAAAPAACSRALMDWDGAYMWMMAANPGGGPTGDVRRVRMDGSGAEQIPGLTRSHHDFAVLPGGTTAFLVWDPNAVDRASYLVERSPEGTLSMVARLDDVTYQTAFGSFHANGLRYYARNDSYTVSDLGTGISLLDRRGESQWHLRATCDGVPPSRCAIGAVTGLYGHQLLENGNLLVFGARSGSVLSPVEEYSFSQEGGTLTAKRTWSYAGPSSLIFGDVHRLPNGNTLVTSSYASTILEVSPAGDVVQTSSFEGKLGYVSFRETLYGPPQ